MLGEEGRAFLESRRALIDRVLKKFGVSPEESASFVELLAPLLTDDDVLVLRSIRSERAFVRQLVRSVETARRTMADRFPAPAPLYPYGIPNRGCVNVTCRAQRIGTAAIRCSRGTARGLFEPNEAFRYILPWLERSSAYRAIEYSHLLSPRDVREAWVIEGWSSGRLAVENDYARELPATRVFLLDRLPAMSSLNELVLVVDFNRTWQPAPRRRR
jgi:hypothetical protein